LAAAHALSPHPANELRLEARRAKAKELVESGLSQRKVAEALGVGEATVRRDLRQDGAESAPESRTLDRDERREAALNPVRECGDR
jgi:predicted transcriptional regulator